MGRWSRSSPIPRTLASPGARTALEVDHPQGHQGLLTYAVEAELPRLFPYPPGTVTLSERHAVPGETDVAPRQTTNVTLSERVRRPSRRVPTGLGEAEILSASNV